MEGDWEVVGDVLKVCDSPRECADEPHCRWCLAQAAIARLEAEHQRLLADNAALLEENERLKSREAVAITALDVARARLGAMDGESLEDAAKRLRADSERLAQAWARLGKEEERGRTHPDSCVREWMADRVVWARKILGEEPAP